MYAPPMQYPSHHGASMASLHSQAPSSYGGPQSHTSSFASLPLPPGYPQPPYQPHHPHQPQPYPPSHLTSYASLPSSSAPAPPPASYLPHPTLPPFQFLRLKSFSTHTNRVLRKLEAAILVAPGQVQGYLDLAEEYRILGARHSYLRLLEYGKEHFPNEPSFRTLLYQHLPNRPRTPPPKEPEIQMERTPTYDYKWRHREQNMFPKQIYKLDTNVPPYGRQLRAHYLHFLSLLRQEDIYMSKARKKELHDEAVRAMEAAESGQNAQQNRENEVAIILPANFNRSKGGAPAVIPSPTANQTNTNPSTTASNDSKSSTPPESTNGGPNMPRVTSLHPSSPSTERKLLSPSADQRRRDSFSDPSTMSGVKSSRKSGSGSGSHGEMIRAAALAAMTPEQRAEYEKEREEQLERKWKEEEREAEERERKEREEIAWREATEQLRRKKEEEARVKEAEAKLQAQKAEEEAKAKAEAEAQAKREAEEAATAKAKAAAARPRFNLTGHNFLAVTFTTSELAKPSKSKIVWSQAFPSAPSWNVASGVFVKVCTAPIDKKTGMTKEGVIDEKEWRVAARTEVIASSTNGEQRFAPLVLDQNLLGSNLKAPILLRVMLTAGGTESKPNMDVLGEYLSTVKDLFSSQSLKLSNPAEPNKTFGILTYNTTSMIAPNGGADILARLPLTMLEPARQTFTQFQLHGVGLKKSGFFAPKCNVCFSVWKLKDELWKEGENEMKITEFSHNQITGDSIPTGSQFSQHLGNFLDSRPSSTAVFDTNPAAPLSPHWQLVYVSEVIWEASNGGEVTFKPTALPLANLCSNEIHRPLLFQIFQLDAKKAMGGSNSHASSPTTSSLGLTGDRSNLLPPLTAAEELGRFVTNFHVLFKCHTLPTTTNAPTSPRNGPKETDKSLYDCVTPPCAGSKKTGSLYVTDTNFFVSQADLPIFNGTN